MNESTKTETSTRRAASHRSLFCPFSLFRFFLALYPFFFFPTLTSLSYLFHWLRWALWHDASTSFCSQNVKHFPDLTSTFARQDLKVGPQEPVNDELNSPFKNSQPGPPPKRLSSDWSYLTQLSHSNRKKQKKTKKSFPRRNCFLLFVKAFVRHLLLPHN